MAYPPPYGGQGYPGSYPSGPGYPPSSAPPPGYPPQDVGYPQPMGYPPQSVGYPPHSGYPPPVTQSYPTGYPAAPNYPPAPGSYPTEPNYPPVGSGYPPPPVGGYPPPAGVMPGVSPGGPQPGYGAGPPPMGGQYGAPPHSGVSHYGAPPHPGGGQYGAPPHLGSQYGTQSPPGSYGQAQAPYGQQPPQQSYATQANVTAQKPSKPPPPATKLASTTAPTSQMASMSLKEKYGHPTIIPKSPFDAEADCELLRKAMRGVGTDEQALINIIVQRSNAQRVEIRLRYKTMFGKDLMNDLKSELSGNLEDCLLALMEPSVLYDAKCLRRAMRGAGTDEETLIDILCTRTNKEIHAIKQSYTDWKEVVTTVGIISGDYKRDLEKDCVSETSGHFKRLLVSMCQGNRDETTTVDMAKATKEATDLFQAGERKWGTDESRFNVVLASRNFAQLRATFDEYVKISQRDILNSIDREMSGNLKSGFRCIVQCARNPAEYFADRLWKSMKGAGTDDATLVRVVVSRSEHDLVEIKRAFLQKYHKTLYKMIEGDCSGDYKKLLLSVVGMN